MCTSVGPDDRAKLRAAMQRIAGEVYEQYVCFVPDLLDHEYLLWDEKHDEARDRALDLLPTLVECEPHELEVRTAEAVESVCREATAVLVGFLTQRAEADR